MMAWSILTPLAGAISSVLLGRRAWLLWPITSLATLVAIAGTIMDVATRGTVRHTVGGWGVPLGIALRADGLAALMLATFGLVGTLVSAYAIAHFGRGRRSERFFSLWFFAWAALDALVLSGDLFNLYVTLELVTLAAAGLVVLDGARPALSAGLRYLLVALFGSLFYLLGVALLYMEVATLDVDLLAARLTGELPEWVALSLMTAGLCVKAGLFPLHAWLPPAYTHAAPPVSAQLSGLVGKAPLLIAVRLWHDVFPVLARPSASDLLGVLGAAGVLWGSVMALRQRRLARMLAYSSLAHVGYFFLLFPLSSPRAYAGTVYIAVSHAVASASMFTAAGNIERAVGHDDLDALKGVAHRRPVTFFAMGLAGTSLMGLPPSSGFVAKWLLARAAIEQGEWWFAVVVLAGGLLAAAYVFPILRGAFLPLPSEIRLRAIPRSAELLTLMLAVVAIALGIAPAGPLSLLGAELRP